MTGTKDIEQPTKVEQADSSSMLQASNSKNALQSEFLSNIAKTALDHFNTFDHDNKGSISKDDLSKVLDSKDSNPNDKAVAQILSNNFDIVDKMATISSNGPYGLLSTDLNPLLKDADERNSITQADLQALLATSSPEAATKLEGEHWSTGDIAIQAMKTAGAGIFDYGAVTLGVALVEDGAIGTAVILGSGAVATTAIAAAGAYGIYRLATSQTGKEIENQIKDRSKMLMSWI